MKWPNFWQLLHRFVCVLSYTLHDVTPIVNLSFPLLNPTLSTWLTDANSWNFSPLFLVGFMLCIFKCSSRLFASVNLLMRLFCCTISVLISSVLYSHLWTRPPIGLRDCVIGLFLLREIVKTILILRDCVNRHACVMRENVEKCA